MKGKLLNLGLLLSSFLGYLEWGTDQSNYLILMEWEILSLLISDPMSALHPFTVIPLLGQILLVITFFQKRVSRLLSYLALGSLSLLYLLILFIGLSTLNVWITLSVLPFVFFGIWIIRYQQQETTRRTFH